MSTTELLPDGVFDSISGQMISDQVIVVEDGRISGLEPASEVPEPIRLEGMTIIPGLIDVHTHLASPLDNGQGSAWMLQRTGAQDALIGVKHAGETLRAGFTSVRDIGPWRAFTDIALRDAIEAGWVAGPRMSCAGAFVTCPGGGGDITGLAVDVDDTIPKELRFGVATGADQMRATARQILRYGADFIKVLATGAVLTSGTNPGAPEMTDEELRAVVEVAEESGTHVAAHAHGTEGIKRAVRAGVRSIEHGSLLDDEAIDLMLEKGTYLVADLYDSIYIMEVGPGLGYTNEVMAKTEMTAEAQREGFRRAVERGVRVAFGTDAGVIPHGINARQFGLYVENGLTGAQAIQSATRWAAELMGWQDRVGSFTPGAFADLVVIDGDPSQDVGLLESPNGVMKGGAWVVNPLGPRDAR